MNAARISLAPPQACTEAYAEGWQAADRRVIAGDDLRIDPPSRWSEAKANGFADRLAEARRMSQ